MDAGIVLIGALAPAAFAQETPPAEEEEEERDQEEDAAEDIPPPSEEIVVYGQLAIDLARDAIIHEMERFGYRVRSEQEGRTILAPPVSWMGAAVLEADGMITFRNPVFAVGVPSETWAVDPRYEDPTTAIPGSKDVQMTTPIVANTPGQEGASGSIMLGGTASMPSKRKRDSVRAQMLAATEDEVLELRRLLLATEAADRGEGP